jgi:hypothetical protein
MLLKNLECAVNTGPVGPSKARLQISQAHSRLVFQQVLKHHQSHGCGLDGFAVKIMVNRPHDQDPGNANREQLNKVKFEYANDI